MTRNAPTTHAPTTTDIETDDFFSEILANPEARAAFEDAQARSDLVDALVKLRRLAGLTQTEVATRMGVKQPMVSGFENEGSDPRLSTLQRYARAVEVTLAMRVNMPAHCDWLPRTDTYQSGTEVHRVAAEAVEPSDRARSWARNARRTDFAPAA